MFLKKIITILLFTLGLTSSSLFCEEQNITEEQQEKVQEVTSKFKAFGLDKVTDLIKKGYNNKNLIAYAAIVSPLFYMYNKILIELIFEKYLEKESSK